MNKKTVRIFTDDETNDILTAGQVKVMIGDVEIPLVSKIELGEDGGGLFGDGFVVARITLAVKLGNG